MSKVIRQTEQQGPKIIDQASCCIGKRSRHAMPELIDADWHDNTLFVYQPADLVRLGRPLNPEFLPHEVGSLNIELFE